jgi:molecular chaperone GrpE
MQSSRASDGREPHIDDPSTPDERPDTTQEPDQAREPPPTAAADHAAEVARLEDRLKRAVADLDNYRKRSGREVERRVTESREAMLRQWLEPLDSLERAVGIDTGSLASGLRAVLHQMEAILARQGVERMGAAGEQFDPALHEAVGVRDVESVPDRTIVEVVRAGYRLGDRVLRPAQVIVSRRPERHD